MAGPGIPLPPPPCHVRSVPYRTAPHRTAPQPHRSTLPCLRWLNNQHSTWMIPPDGAYWYNARIRRREETSKYRPTNNADCRLGIAGRHEALVGLHGNAPTQGGDDMLLHYSNLHYYRTLH
ncbi:hypothetical protein CSOJ01_00885 [Colletotrichum sojae]|uniref:Uncharacterized protein n=1 Tax=Colletotrichum sojae TaxID=2175907 RepID=A0A8H6JVM8_9PEZI|nr:hypothetical protein CSOJ01_00885 [Colletotrichum sojae]